MASKRNYLTQAELAEFADINIVDGTEADDQISQAEEIIDSWVGAQQRHLSEPVIGHAAAGGSASFTLEAARHQNVYEQDYFVECDVEIIGGTGSGKTRRRIISSTKAGVITVDSNFDTAPDSTSIYKIFQLGKFPRRKDMYQDVSESDPRWYASIPEAVKRATAAQVAFMIEKGNSYFAGDDANKTSETIGDYSYSMGSGGTAGSGGVARLIAPRAKLLLRGITNRVGVMIV